MPTIPSIDTTSLSVTVAPYCGPYTVGLAGSPVYVLCPTSFPDLSDAIAWGIDYFSRVPVELYILSTNGVMRHNYENASLIMPSAWTILDAINQDTYDDGASTVGGVFTAEEGTPEGIIINYGNELADADYRLEVNGNIATVKSVVGTDGVTSLPAPGRWVFRVGGTGMFDAPSVNFRDYSGMAGNTMIEAQDANQETPVISILFNKTKSTFIENAFFGYPVLPSQVDQYGYVTPNNSYGVPEGTTDGAQWLTAVDSYPPFTSVPTILGPVIRQGETSSDNIYSYTGSGIYNGTCRGFVARPNDPAYDDNGILPGRYLAGFRLRFLTIARTIQTTEQAGTLHPAANGIAEYLEPNWGAPVVSQVGFSYAEDISKRWLKPHSDRPNMPTSIRDTIFPFDSIVNIPLDIVPNRDTGVGSPITTFLDGSPLLTLDPNAGPVGDNHAVLRPYAMNFYAPYAPATTGPFYFVRNDSFVGYAPTTKTTQGTYWIQVRYGASNAYVIRDANNVETFEYGDETTFDLAMMVRRQEPPPPGVNKMVPEASTMLRDTFNFTTSGYLYHQDLVPVWDTQTLVNIDCVTPGRGFYIYEKWFGDSYYGREPDPNNPGYGWKYYYPGYYDALLEPNSPMPPTIWERVSNIPGNTYSLKQWGGPSDGQLIRVTGGTSYVFENNVGNVGGKFLIQAYAIIAAFEWGGSVPYSMPPPFATSVPLLGIAAGDNQYGPSQWISAGELPEVSTAISQGRWALDAVTGPLIWPFNTGPVTVQGFASGQRPPVPDRIAGYPEHNDANGNGIPYTASDILPIDAFFGNYTPPVFPPPPPKGLYGYASGTIDIYFSDDGIDSALQGFYNSSVTVTINDPRNTKHIAYWQDYGGNIQFDRPDKTGGITGVVSDPPGKIVLGYDQRLTIGEAGGTFFYEYISPRYATGPIRMFVNADINLTQGTGFRSALTSTDAPTYPPFDVLVPHSSQGPGIGVLQVECNDGTSRNVQIYLKPPRVNIPG